MKKVIQVSLFTFCCILFIPTSAQPNIEQLGVSLETLQNKLITLTQNLSQVKTSLNQPQKKIELVEPEEKEEIFEADKKPEYKESINPIQIKELEVQSLFLSISEILSTTQKIYFNRNFSNLKKYQAILAENFKQQNTPFKWCTCEMAREKLRRWLMLNQLNDIVGLVPDNSQQIVLTAFAEYQLLQSFLLTKALIAIGYKKIHVNLIGPGMSSGLKEIVSQITDKTKKELYGNGKRDLTKKEIASLFRSYLPDDNRVTVKAYSYGYEYALDKNAPESHSFDMIDVNDDDDSGEDITKVKETDFNNRSLLVLKNDTLVIYFYLSHHTPPRIRTYFIYVNANKQEEQEKQIFVAIKDQITIFSQQLKNNQFKTRKEIINWIKENKKTLDKFGEFRINLACSAPMDFEEIVDRKSVKNENGRPIAIIYELQKKEIRSYINGYKPEPKRFPNTTVGLKIPI